MTSPPIQRKFTISGRQFNYQNPENALNFWHFYIKKFYGADRIESFFNSVKQRSRLYGGRPCSVELSFSGQHVEFLNSKGIGIMLTLSNHYFSEEAYAETLPILKRFEHPLNGLAITNDTLALRIKQDFPLFKRKASVIKLINTLDDIHKALELYDEVMLHPAFNDNPEFLQRIDCKERIVLFANIRCLYKCQNPICYKYISQRIMHQKAWDKHVCNHQGDEDVKNNYVIFDLSEERFNGFSSFKLIPVPDEHLTLNYQHSYQQRSVHLLKNQDGSRMIR